MKSRTMNQAASKPLTYVKNNTKIKGVHWHFQRATITHNEHLGQVNRLIQIPNLCFIRTLSTQVLHKTSENTTTNASVVHATVIRMQKLYEQGYHSAIETEWKRFMHSGWVPTGVMYGIIMKVYAKSGNVDKMNKTWARMLFEGHTPNKYHFLAQVQCLCEASLPQKAEYTIQSMTKYGIEPDTEIYNTLLKGYCEHLPESTRVKEIYDMVIEKNLSDNATFSIMMEYCGKQGMQQAADYLERLRSEKRLDNNSHVYNALIATCGNTGNHDRIPYYLQQMEAAGIKRDIWTFRSLMKAYSTTPNLTDTFNEFRALKPQPEDYAQYVFYVAGQGDLGALEKAFQLLQKDGIPYTTDMFNHIFISMKESKKWQLATPVLNLMKKYRVPRNTRTYNIILNVYGRCERFIEMHQTFEDMRLETNPDSYTMSTLIERCYHHSHYDKASQYYQFSVARKIQLPHDTVVHVLVTYVLLGNWKQVNDIMAQYQYSSNLYIPLIASLTHHPPKVIYNFYFSATKNFPMCIKILDHLMQSERYDEAATVLEDIVQHRWAYQPVSNKHQWTLVLDHMVRLHKVQVTRGNQAALDFILDATNKLNEVLVQGEWIDEGMIPFSPVHSNQYKKELEQSQ